MRAPVQSDASQSIDRDVGLRLAERRRSLRLMEIDLSPDARSRFPRGASSDDGFILEVKRQPADKAASGPVSQLERRPLRRRYRLDDRKT